MDMNMREVDRVCVKPILAHAVSAANLPSQWQGADVGARRGIK